MDLERTNFSEVETIFPVRMEHCDDVIENFPSLLIRKIFDKHAALKFFVLTCFYLTLDSITTRM